MGMAGMTLMTWPSGYLRQMESNAGFFSVLGYARPGGSIDRVQGAFDDPDPTTKAESGLAQLLGGTK